MRRLNKRVIWTLDLRDPLKPEIVSIWACRGRRWKMPRLATIRCRRRHLHLHGPPMIRGNRMYAAFWGAASRDRLH